MYRALSVLRISPATCVDSLLYILPYLSISPLIAMNHSQALVATPHERCLTAILQFLKDNGFHHSFEALQSESKKEWTAPLEGEQDALVNALMAYDERRNAFKHKATSDADAMIDRAINGLKLAPDLAASHCSLTLTPHSANITTVKWQHSASSALLASGGVDKVVKVTDIASGDVVNAIPVLGPVLSMDFSKSQPDLLLVGCMNGDVLLLDLTQTPPILLKTHEHTKYVIAVEFAPDGASFASASHDGTVVTYTRSAVTGAFALHHRWEYRNAVETVAWLSSSVLCVAPREDNYLHLMHVPSRTEQARVNMNLTGDDHVSFSAMNIAASPDASLLAVATDQHRLIVLAAGTPIQVRNYWGLQNDGYSTPRVSWSRSGRFVYVSQQDASVCVYDASEGKSVGVLRGHDTNVRDVDCHPFKDLVATASFDRTVRVWKADD